LKNKDLIITTDIYNMKRYIIALFFIIFCSVLSAQVFTSINVAYGYQYANKSFNDYEKDAWDVGSRYTASVYWFPANKNFGLFTAFSLNMLPSIWGHSGNNSLSVAFSPDISIGGGFRYKITNKNELYTGLAASIDIVSSYSAEERIFTLSGHTYNDKTKITFFSITPGIVNETGIRYRFSEYVYMNYGLKLGISFLQYNHSKAIHNDTETITKKPEKDYFKISAMPYIGVGLKLPMSKL